MKSIIDCLAIYSKQQALYEATFEDASKYDLAHYANKSAKLPLDFEQSENWQYGPFINIAARVIEKVSGMIKAL